MDREDDILHIAKYFVSRYGAAAAALMDSRASACDHDGDADAAGLWRCVAAEIRKAEQGDADKARAEPAGDGAAAPEVVPDSHVRFAFQATPHPYLLLTPNLTIAAVNDSYLGATMTRRDEIVGKAVFDALPDNPAWADADGVRNLSASLARVIDRRQPDWMGVQRHDVRRPDGAFEERWWSSLNTPAFDQEGRLVLIVHHTHELKAGSRGRA